MEHWKSITVTVLLSVAAVSPVQASGTPDHASRAANHSTQATGHSAAMSAKTVAGSVALPLAIVGTAGQASGQAAEELWSFANQPIGTLLPIAQETFTAGHSPKEAMLNTGDNQ